MDARKIVLRETGIVALGVSLWSVVMVGVFAFLGCFDASVALGAVTGTALAVLNFLVMAVCASLAADKAVAQDAKGGQALLHASQVGRYIVLAVLLVACGHSGRFHLVALALPSIFVQPTIIMAEFFRKPGEKTV